MMQSKNKIVSIISMIGFVVLIAIAAFAYAYFTANVVATNNLSISANVNDGYVPVFTAYSLEELNLSVTAADMLPYHAGAANDTVADADSQTIFVSLIGGSSTSPATCSFSLKWKNNGDDYSPTTYQVVSDAGITLEPYEKEFTISVKDSDGNVILEETSVEDMENVSEWEDDLFYNIGSFSISSNGVLTEKRYIVTATIYNLNADQSGLYNKKFNHIVYVDNVVC